MDIALFPEGQDNIFQMAPALRTIPSSLQIFRNVWENPMKEWFRDLSKGPKGLRRNLTFSQPVPTETLKNSHYVVVSHSLFSRVLGKLSTN